MITRRAAALAIAMACAQPAAAATVDYSSLHVFGDSLSDVGNLYRAHLRPRAGEPALLERPLLQRPGLGRPGGRRLPRDGHADRQPRLGRRQGALRPRRDPRPRPCRRATIAWSTTTGGATGRSRRCSPAATTSSTPPARRGDPRRRAAGGGGGRRRRRGRSAGPACATSCCSRSSDIGATPRFGGDPPAASSASRGVAAFNRELDEQIAALRGRGARVAVVDAHGLFEDLLAHPRKYGVRNTTTPCLDADGDRCGPRQGRWRAFFDDVHPNRVVHRRLGGAVMAQIDPPTATMAAASPAAVPLPPSAVLLLAGAAVARRCRGYQRSRRGPSAAPSPVTARMPSPYQTA